MQKSLLSGLLAISNFSQSLPCLQKDTTGVISTIPLVPSAIQVSLPTPPAHLHDLAFNP
jgi:hypothetical protein